MNTFLRRLRIRLMSHYCRQQTRRDGPNPAMVAAVSERVTLPVPTVSRVLGTIATNMARFERGGFYCFDDATAEDLQALAQESGEPPEHVASILRAARDAIIEWAPAAAASVSASKTARPGWEDSRDASTI